VNLKHITILFKIFLVDLSIYLLKEGNFIRKERNKNYSRVFLVDDNKVKDHELRK
jgi:flagellar biosynthesis regulator FlaF